MRTQEELRGPRLSSRGQDTTWAKKGQAFQRKGQGRRADMPSEAPVFLKLQGSINAMYSETSIDLSF